MHPNLERISRPALARAVPVALAACLLGGAAQPAEPLPLGVPLENLVLMHVDGAVEIEPDGRVGTVAFKTRFDEGLRASLEEKMRAWRFKPVQIGGEARRVQTQFRVMLAAEMRDGKYHVNIDSTCFSPDQTAESVAAATVPDGVAPPITARRMAPPQYPFNQMMSGEIGSVHLVIRVSPDGRVADVVATQSLVFDIGGKESDVEARRSIRAFEAAAIGAARKWSFNVPAGAGSRSASDMTVSTDVEYQIRYNTGLDGQWVPVKRAPKRAVAWLPPEQSEAGGVGMGAAGQVAGIDSTYRLQQPVDGTPVM